MPFALCVCRPSQACRSIAFRIWVLSSVAFQRQCQMCVVAHHMHGSPRCAGNQGFLSRLARFARLTVVSLSDISDLLRLAMTFSVTFCLLESFAALPRLGGAVFRGCSRLGPCQSSHPSRLCTCQPLPLFSVTQLSLSLSLSLALCSSVLSVSLVLALAHPLALYARPLLDSLSAACIWPLPGSSLAYLLGRS